MHTRRSSVRISPKQKEFLYLEISKLLKAGLPIEKAAESILDHEPQAAQRLYLETLIEKLKSGSSIAEATNQMPVQGISAMEKKMVDAGEKGGKLEHAYRHLGEYFSLLNKTARTIKTQLIYPVVLIHLAILLPTIPKTVFLKMFGQDASHVFRNAIISLLLIYAVGALLWFAYRQLSAAAEKSEGIDRILNRLPLSGKLRRFFSLARFTGVLRIYLLSGQKTAESVLGAGEASLSGGLYAASQRMGAKIAQGSPLGKEIKSESGFPKDFKRAVGTAEDAGSLDEEAGRWEGIFIERAETSADRLSAWFPKVVYFLALGLMAWQIISVFSAYFGGMTDMIDSSY